jgi:hypothetical protein
MEGGMKTNPRDHTPMHANKRESAPEKPSGSYAAIPDAVIKSQAYINLSDAAVRLLVELVSHHDGFNNGMLHTAYTALAKRGLGSHNKVERAFGELMNSGFIIKTRSGGLNAGPDCYALLWLPATPKDRAGNQKDMPMLPRPYPINRFMIVHTAPREKMLKGAARQSRSAKMEKMILGDDEQICSVSPASIEHLANPAQEHLTTPAQYIGNTVLLAMGGTVEMAKAPETVPPKGADYPAHGNGLSRPSKQRYPAQGDSWAKFLSIRRFKPPYRIAEQFSFAGETICTKHDDGFSYTHDDDAQSAHWDADLGEFRSPQPVRKGTVRTEAALEIQRSLAAMRR